MSTFKPVSQRQAVTMIRDREEFDASALTGRVVSYFGPWDSGYLYGRDLAAFRRDASSVRYVVFSYSTPIAWYTEDGHWHVVAGRFSATTSSRHQSKLYLIPHATHSVAPALIGRGRGWRVECNTCRDEKVDGIIHDSRRAAEDHAHYHRLNGDR